MSSAAFAFDHLSPLATEKLCYVHCSFCDTVLAVSVPCSSLFKTVTVRCGHCTNLLSVNMRALLLPAANQLHHGDTFLIPAHTNLLRFFPLDHSLLLFLIFLSSIPPSSSSSPLAQYPLHLSLGDDPDPGLPKLLDSPPEKRQRVPSAYNRFIKEEIQRIKAGNPDITHREAFSAAAKNWAHFPHIHFGLMPDQGPKSIVRQQVPENPRSGF
ncbi:unnamed protein product [Spirodela intermedia]|uniref:Uncharacterized protein n=1 Tax=Spirodela intermedia TaxID=51605 RepID=A0A7I8IEH8_SPIIN|nr:unnamed protein product [Spirodela intermedia]CAA6656198.1 unnamed protein product [Spirodela intermedia]